MVDTLKDSTHICYRSIQKTGLRQFPYLGELKTTHILHTVYALVRHCSFVPISYLMFNFRTETWRVIKSQASLRIVSVWELMKCKCKTFFILFKKAPFPRRSSILPRIYILGGYILDSANPTNLIDSADSVQVIESQLVAVRGGQCFQRIPNCQIVSKLQQ